MHSGTVNLREFCCCLVPWGQRVCDMSPRTRHSKNTLVSQWCWEGWYSGNTSASCHARPGFKSWSFLLWFLESGTECFLYAAISPHSPRACSESQNQIFFPISDLRIPHLLSVTWVFSQNQEQNAFSMLWSPPQPVYVFRVPEPDFCFLRFLYTCWWHEIDACWFFLLLWISIWWFECIILKILS